MPVRFGPANPNPRETMEPYELEKIAKLAPSHDELKRLMFLHEGYEKSLSRLESVRHPSEAERREISRIKRLKLRGKDRIRVILADH